MRKKILALTAFSVISTPAVAVAAPHQNFAVCSSNPWQNLFGFQPWYACLSKAADGTPSITGLNDIFLIVFPVVDSLIKIAALVAVGVIFFMLIQMVIARGDAGKIKTSAEGIRDAVIGLIITLLSVGIVNFTASAFTYTPSQNPQPPAGSTGSTGGTNNGTGGTSGSGSGTGSTGGTGGTSGTGGTGGTSGSSTKPSAANTGIAPGTQLTVITGDTVITRPGVYANMDYRGGVKIQASNVTIRNSRISGPLLRRESGCSAGQATGATYALSVASSATNFVLENSEVIISDPHRKLSGVGGANMTIRNSEIARGVDGIGIVGNNVILENNYIHSLYYYPYDPYQRCTPTHNDGVQVHYGSTNAIRNNTILGKPFNASQGNAAIMVNQNGGRTTRNITINGNWIDYGMCSVNVSQNGGSAISGLTMSSNKMGKNVQTVSGSKCAFVVDKATLSLSSGSIKGNVWEDGSLPVPRIFSGR